MNAMAECRDLTVRYSRKLALDAVSLTVSEGSVYALLGRNGAGKSSLVRCLLGQQKPEQGQAQLFGEDVWTSRTRAMARVGVVPEEPDVPPGMNAEQVMNFCAELYPRWDRASVRGHLDRFRVPLRTPVGRLSKGQKAQLSMALALGPQPDLLVLDDPTLGLDAVARRELYEELLGELADRGTTVFITTHDLSGIEGIASRVGILKEGRLVVDEEVESLKARFRRIRCAALDPAQTRQALNGFQVIDARSLGMDTETIVADFDETRFSMLGLIGEAEALSLEELFIAVVGDEKEVTR
jgi:ABC-2 type transport system ATP-binding protein